MLCDYCRHVRLPHEQKTARRRWTAHICLVRHHACFDDLIASADAGCELCQAFRPFVEYAKSRAQGTVERSESDCSSSDTLGYTHEDPFGAIDRGRSLPSEEGGGVLYEYVRKQNYTVRPGCYYEDDSDEEKYRYLEDDPEWNPRRITDVGNQVDADDEAYQKELRERLAKLGLRSASTHSIEEPDETDNPVQRFHKRMHACRAERFEGVQWALSTAAHHAGPEQLWINLSRFSEQGDLETSASDDVCLVTLTAGSCDPEYLDDGPDICLNGVSGYTQYTLATLYPEIWKYKSNKLRIPRKRPDRDLRPVFEFYQKRDDTFITTPRIQSREVGADPAASKVLGLARSWLSRCVESHERCKLQKDAPIPTRLIDVGEHNAQSNIRLRVTDGREDDIRYATLSHCWGPDQAMLTKLQKDNLSILTGSIRTTSLSKNFQDAIIITRSLGLRYLWVDALCILQDSQDDWEVESSKIAEYYRGSEVTIVALASPHAGHGILRQRPTTIPSVPIQVEGGILHLRLLLQDSVSVTNASGAWVRKSVATQPLSKRAWTLQERLFSRRLLYFTEEQMIWQCRSRFFAEDGQYSHGRKGGTAMVERDIVDILNYQPRIIGKEKRRVDPSVQSTQWFSLVKAYTQRHLTYDTDKLPGISGLAREVSQVTKIRYVAGLWIGNRLATIASLLWNPVGDRWNSKGLTADPRRANNQCPTWSWASIVAEIEHPLADDPSLRWKPDLDPVFISARANANAGNPFGEVQGGRLVLKCWTCPYRGVETYDSLIDQAWNRYDWGDEYGTKTSDDPRSPGADPFVVFDLAPPDNLWDSENQEAAKRTFKLVFIVYDNEFETDPLLEHASQYFLLLEGDHKRGRGCFVRAGTAHTQSGTLFTIDEKHGWVREEVQIF